MKSRLKRTSACSRRLNDYFELCVCRFGSKRPISGAGTPINVDKCASTTEFAANGGGRWPSRRMPSAQPAPPSQVPRSLSGSLASLSRSFPGFGCCHEQGWYKRTTVIPSIDMHLHGTLMVNAVLGVAHPAAAQPALVFLADLPLPVAWCSSGVGSMR